MKRTYAMLAAAVVCLGSALTVAAQETAPRVPDQLNATINIQQTADPFRNMLGSFIEHIGRTIYRSMWAELLDDRKFWFPITSKDSKTPRSQSGNPMRQRCIWRPVGPDNGVVMDINEPFVSDHSPKILLDGATPHGIRQRGFSLVNGKEYTGRICLRGTPGTKVTVTLIWGSDASGRQTTVQSHADPEYKQFPLGLYPQGRLADAALEITGTGSGDFHIGAVSLIPADNIQGFRPDTIALLKQHHSGMWRLPGGNFLSDWIWYDAIGDIDKRPPMFDHAWNAMQVNDVGMDEFMTLCKLIDVDPYVTVNAGLGDSHSAAEEVEYLNGSASTAWGAARQEWPSGALSHQVLEHRQRALGHIPDRLHRSEILRDQE